MISTDSDSGNSRPLKRPSTNIVPYRYSQPSERFPKPIPPARAPENPTTRWGLLRLFSRLIRRHASRARQTDAEVACAAYDHTDWVVHVGRYSNPRDEWKA
jgi:hypothetical protein